MDELVLVDTRDRELGPCGKLAAHRAPLLHRAFSIFLCSQDQMLLQRRNRAKYHSGGLWANACCSHPRMGESLETAARRRMEEELGMSVPVEELFSFLYFAKFSDCLYEYEYDHVFLGRCTQIPPFNPQEIEEMRWVGFDTLRSELVRRPEEFSVWFLSAAPRVLDLLEGR